MSTTIIAGSCGLEDMWHTKNPHRRQMAGILGFCFTNAYLAMKFFAKQGLEHHIFKIAASNALINHKTESFLQTRDILLDTSTDAVLHEIERIQYSLVCYYCQHGYQKPREGKNTTTFKCKACKIPICRPSKSQCWVF